MSKQLKTKEKDLFGGAEAKSEAKRTPAKAAPRGTGGEADYTAADIEVLEGLEPVRRRPGMYIGGTDEKALHHLFAEVIDNSMDEAVAGHATFIGVEDHLDHLGVAGDRLVHGVVEHLGEQVVQGPLVGAADVHARPLADRLQTFKDLDVLGRIAAALADRGIGARLMALGQRRGWHGVQGVVAEKVRNGSG